ncbi:MAG TPA: iron chelate uptake ABC transporter family permease subunit, partial [Acidimicrobiales bacterium]
MHGRGDSRPARPEVVTERLRARWLVAGAASVAVAAVIGVTIGPVSIAPHRVLLEIVDHLPGVDVDSGLSEVQASIVWDIRLPRVVLGLLVGAMLSIAGGSYQGA